jgi:hypothetical protein
MRRRELIAGIGATAAWPLAARAQQRNQIKRIAFINPTGAGSAVDVPIKQELAKLGMGRGPQRAHRDPGSS